MHTGRTSSTRLLLIIAAIACVLLVVVVATSFVYITGITRQESAALTATTEAEMFLTSVRGAEVQAVIENFKTKWLSLESYEDSGTQSKLATETYLAYWGLARMGRALYDEPFWLVTKSSSVTRVRVFEYSPERFKAIAQVELLIDQLTPAGNFVKSLPPYKSCGFYVFLREDELWKLAEYFDLASSADMQRDWASAPNEVKQIIGNLPANAVNLCDDHTSR